MDFASLIRKGRGRIGRLSCQLGYVQLAGWLLTCGLLAGSTGCTVTVSCPSCFAPKEPPPPPPVNDVLTYWDNRVRITSDSVSHGKTLPGLAGRVWLFSSGKTVDANGHMTIELYNMSRVAAGGQPERLADWTFDAEALKQLKRPDLVGEGYTLFLPWETYRPDITQIKVQLAYVPYNGSPYYTDPMLMTLRPDEPLTIHTTNKEITPAPNPPVAQQQPTQAKK